MKARWAAAILLSVKIYAGCLLKMTARKLAFLPFLGYILVIG
jgi:hypothetical protein